MNKEGVRKEGRGLLLVLPCHSFLHRAFAFIDSFSHLCDHFLLPSMRPQVSIHLQFTGYLWAVEPTTPTPCTWICSSALHFSMQCHFRITFWLLLLFLYRRSSFEPLAIDSMIFPHLWTTQNQTLFDAVAAAACHLPILFSCDSPALYLFSMNEGHWDRSLKRKL